MSLSAVPLNIALISDPVLDLHRIDTYTVYRGTNNVTYQIWPISSVSSNGFNLTANPPTSSIVFDRQMWLITPCQLGLSGTVTTSNSGYTPSTALLTQGRDALRMIPIAGAIQNMAIYLNNDKFTMNWSDVLHTLLHYGVSEEVKRKDYSMTPMYEDNFYNYGDTFGTAASPLGAATNVSQGEVVPRGGFPMNITQSAVTPSTGGTAATAVVQFVDCIPFWISPCYAGPASQNNQGFYNCNQFNLNVNFVNNAWTRMWSSDPSVISTGGSGLNVTRTITSGTVQFNNFTSPAFPYPYTTPIFIARYLSPDLLNTQQVIGPNVPITYAYSEVYTEYTIVGAITNASGIQPLNTNSTTVNQVPRRVYLSMRPSVNAYSQNATLTDCFGVINSISISFGAKNGLLSSCSQQQLCSINWECGSDASWEQFSGQGVYANGFPSVAGSGKIYYGGAPLCLEFGKHISLDPNLAVGLGGSYTFQAKMMVSNNNASGAWDAVEMALQVTFVYEGTVVITGLGQTSDFTGVISREDVILANEKKGITYSPEYSGGYSFSDFTNSLGSFLGKINTFLRDTRLASTIAKEVAPYTHPVVGKVGNVLHRLGYGEDGGCDEGMGRRRGAAAISSQYPQGGRSYSKSELKRLMY